MKQIIVITTVDRCEVVTSKKSRNFLNECLNALFRPNVKDFDVVLFDGGSASIDFITKIDKFSYITKVIESRKKLSVIKNTNRALKYASENYNTDWVFLLQDDIVTQEKVLLKLPKLLEEAPKDAGMLTFTCSNRKTTYHHYEFCRGGRNKFVPYPKRHWYMIWFAAFKRTLIKDWLTSQMCANGLKKNHGIDNYIGVWIRQVSKVYAYDTPLALHTGNVSAKGSSTSWRKRAN